MPRLPFPVDDSRAADDEAGFDGEAGVDDQTGVDDGTGVYEADSDAGAEAGGDRRPLATPRDLILLGSAFVTSLLLMVMAMLPAPYVIEQPGPTVDTLGEVDGSPLITVNDAETFPTEGSLRLTTVSVSGGPGSVVDAVSVVKGWLASSSAVVPVEAVFPTGQTSSERDQVAQAAMTTSQENSTAAALTELGYEVPTTLVIAGAVEGSGAYGVVEEGDVLTSIDGTPLPTFPVLDALLAATPPGTTLEAVILRAGEPMTVEIVTGDDEAGGSVLGIYLDPIFDFPVDVQIQIENIGGPSAGTMFALGIIDTLTPGSMTGGQDIAGTGTISLAGAVGAIGGIRQKMAGALRDGADYFLAPASNCADVEGYVPAGLQVISVATLAEARAAVTAIGEGAAADLPGCSAS